MHCDFVTYLQGSLKKHIYSEHQLFSDSKFVQCPECQVLFTKGTSMKRHYRSQHEGIKYSCKECSKQFTQKENFQKHMKSKHKGIK